MSLIKTDGSEYVYDAIEKTSLPLPLPLTLPKLHYLVKEDPVEFDSSLTLCSDMRGVVIGGRLQQ